MNPHYYLMKSKKILRLEAEISFQSLPLEIKEKVLVSYDIQSLTQEQANWRVVIFRDEIMEMDEYQDWLKTPEALLEDEWDYDLTAN
jgi:hypothetical protein